MLLSNTTGYRIYARCWVVLAALIFSGAEASAQGRPKKNYPPAKPAATREQERERERAREGDSAEEQERRLEEEREKRIRAERRKLVSQGKTREERELLETQNERWEAEEERDLPALRRALAEDFSLTFEEGLVFDKTQVLAMVEHRPEGEIENRLSDVKVRLYGDTAIITGRHTVIYESNDRNTFRETRYTDTYLKRNRRWYLVASHFAPNRVKP